MKKTFVSLSVAALTLSLSFLACKKDISTPTLPPSDNTEIALQADDESQLSGEVDAVASDVDAAVESSSAITGRFDGVAGITICDASVVVDNVSDPRTVTITYDGTNCHGNRTRTGVVVVSIPQTVKWKMAGAAITVNVQNLKITRLRDNKSVTINGTQVYTNVSGGLLIDLATAGPITHTITSSGISVTFSNTTARTWQVAKQRVFTYDNGGVVTTTGTHTEGSETNVAEWGTNRFGNAFTTSTVTPLVVRQDCDFRLTSGEVKHVTPNVTATATFGLDSSGNPTSCPGAGSYYYKLVWQGPSGNPVTVIAPY